MREGSCKEQQNGGREKGERLHTTIATRFHTTVRFRWYHSAMAISDTSLEIEAMQIKIRQSMTQEQRLEVALDLSDLLREFRKAGIRRDHPDWTERQVMIELFRLAFLPEPLPTWVR